MGEVRVERFFPDQGGYTSREATPAMGKRPRWGGHQEAQSQLFEIDAKVPETLISKP